jgi:hypothetical protein
MKNKETREHIKNLALDLPIGGVSERQVCPFCGGGSHRESTFNVTRTADGLLYNCFRASCPDGHGFIGSKNVVSDYNPKIKEFKPKLFTRPLYKLPNVIRDWMMNKYRLTAKEIADAGFKYDLQQKRVYMPIFNILGYTTGAVARSFNGGNPKAVNYKFNDELKFYFPNGELSGDSVVIVEDIISAIRCKRLFGNAVALLGTGLNAEQASYLAQFFRHIIYALDPDAVQVAIDHAIEYQLLFDSSRVAFLSADPKDMSDEQLRLEVAGGEKTD